jgi:hypothetical protein
LGVSPHKISAVEQTFLSSKVFYLSPADCHDECRRGAACRVSPECRQPQQ